MPIPLPNLDDRTFDDLFEEARSLIPVLLPEWTDHNAADPGIILVEMLAAMAEGEFYAVNQITDAQNRAFLRLLNGPGWTLPAGADLATATRQTLQRLHERHRAVTADDYEYLVREIWPTEAAAADLARIQTVRCLPGQDLSAAEPEPAPGHISVVLLPEPSTESDTHPTPSDALLASVEQFLDPRRLLTVRHHVVGPGYVDLRVSANLALTADAPAQQVRTEAITRLLNLFDPRATGPDRTGWPFGRSAHVTQVYAELERSSGIDYIEDLVLSGPDVDAGQEDGSIALRGDQLFRLSRIDLFLYDRYGTLLADEPWEIDS